MTRSRLTLAAVVSLLALPLIGCHWPKRVLVVSSAGPTAATPAAVTVSGAVDAPAAVPVPLEGTSLRRVVEAVKVTGNADTKTPGSVYAHITRPEGEYYVALSLITGGGAGNIRIAPDDTVRIVKWEQTDLARGLKEEKKEIPPQPADAENLPAVVAWLRQVFGAEANAILEGGKDKAIGGTAEEFAEAFDDIFGALAVVKNGLSPQDFLLLQQEAAKLAGKKERERRDWLRNQFVPAVATVAQRKNDVIRERNLKTYVADWGYLGELYKAQGRPVVAADGALAAITATFSAESEPAAISEAQLRVRNPNGQKDPSPKDAGHPSFATYFALLSEWSEPGVVRLIRMVNGRRTEFVLELITKTNKITWGMDERDREQDYNRLQDMLIFDGDVLEVTTLNRVAPVVEATVLDILAATKKAKAAGK